MREICLPRLELIDDLERLFDIEMRYMSVWAKRVEHQSIQSLQHRHARVGNVANVGTVSNIANAESKHIKIGAVLQRYWQHRRTKHIKGRSTLDLVHID